MPHGLALGMAKKGKGRDSHVAGGVSEQTGQKLLVIRTRRIVPLLVASVPWLSTNRFAQRRRQVPGTISQIFPSGHE